MASSLHLIRRVRTFPPYYYSTCAHSSLLRQSGRCGRCAIEGEKDWRCFRIYIKQSGELRHDLPLKHCVVTADEDHAVISVDFYKERAPSGRVFGREGR